MIDNDKTIFEWLKPQENNMFSMFNDVDLMDLLVQLDKYYLEYRKVLDIDSGITFGIEIEIDKFILSIDKYWQFYIDLINLVGGKNWDVKNDITLKCGREITSSVLVDSIYTWQDIKKVCGYVSQYGEIDRTCSAHVHVGSQILGNNPLYWYRLFKLWSRYENVIYRFCYGEYLTHRDCIVECAKPTRMLFNRELSLVKDRLDSISLLEMFYLIKPKDISQDMLKKYGISYWHMLADDEYNLFEDFGKFNYGCTMEFRVANGTYNEIIWQNLILFYIKLMEYCKSDNFNEDLFDDKDILFRNEDYDIWDYSKIYLKQALELCDIIYDKNIDKVYFLRQYLKSCELSNRTFVKARKITV